MSGNTSIVDATPNFVEGDFGGQDVRLGTMWNARAGLFAAGDFACSQRSAGANMSLDIAQGRALVDPQQATHQGLYVVRRTSGTAYNTSADGAYTWSAADGANPRIDLVCIEVKDTEMDSSGTTGFRFSIVDGTPNAGATHQMETAYWPAVPTGCLPIAVVRVPAAATTLTTANITNLNPMGGFANPSFYSAAAETTTSASYARTTTPAFCFAYCPASSLVHFTAMGKWKTAAAATAGIAVHINGTRWTQTRQESSPFSTALEVALGTANFYSTYVTDGTTGGGATAGGYSSVSATGADSSDGSAQIIGESTGLGSGNATPPLQIRIPTAGWYVFEERYKTSASTLSVDERHIWLQVMS